MTDQTYKRVCSVIGELTGLDPAEIAPAQALGQTATPNFYWQGEPPKPLALDSYDRVALAMQLEDEFKITITDEEVDDPALDHVGGLVAFVQGKLDARGGQCVCGLGDTVLHACGVIPPRDGVGGVFPGPDSFPLVIHATATASPFGSSIGFDPPRTPTSSASSPTQTDGVLELTEDLRLTNCGVIEAGPFERYSVSEDTWLRLGGHGAQAYAKRIFEVGWFEGISREKDRNGRTLQIAWAAFAEREGLRP